MGYIVFAVIFFIIGSCNGLQALVDRNPNSSLGGWVISIFFFVFSAILITTGIKKIIKPESVDQQNFKKCPFCAEYVNKNAIKCKHCGSQLNSNISNQVLPGKIKACKTCGNADLQYSIRDGGKSDLYCPICKQVVS